MRKSDWDNLFRLMVVSTACLCMLIIVGGLFYGVLFEKLPAGVLAWGTGAALSVLVGGVIAMIRIVFPKGVRS